MSYPGNEKSVRKHKPAWPEAGFYTEISHFPLKHWCSVHSGWVMVLRFLLQMVLNFQIAVFTKVLQTSLLFECLGLHSYVHAEKPNPSPGGFEVSEWFCPWVYFDHTDSVISKIKRFRFMRWKLSACIWWAVLKIAEVATAGRLYCWEYVYELPRIFIPA